MWTLRLYRKLYKVLGNILEEQYGQNLGVHKVATVVDVIAPIPAIDQDLREWADTLPPGLRTLSSSDLLALLSSFEISPRQRLANHFRVVLTLRYLNVRVLLHRPVLDKYIESSYSLEHEPSANVLLSRLGSHSACSCFKSAIEIVTIVRTLVETQGPAKAWLNAWWFTVYYSKCSPDLRVLRLKLPHSFQCGSRPVQCPASFPRRQTDNLEWTVEKTVHTGPRDGCQSPRTARRWEQYCEEMP